MAVDWAAGVQARAEYRPIGARILAGAHPCREPPLRRDRARGSPSGPRTTSEMCSADGLRWSCGPYSNIGRRRHLSGRCCVRRSAGPSSRNRPIGHERGIVRAFGTEAGPTLIRGRRGHPRYAPARDSLRRTASSWRSSSGTSEPLSRPLQVPSPARAARLRWAHHRASAQLAAFSTMARRRRAGHRPPALQRAGLQPRQHRRRRCQ
jgi:hypothetical protein